MVMAKKEALNEDIPQQGEFDDTNLDDVFGGLESSKD